MFTILTYVFYIIRALYVRLFNNATRDVFDFDKCPDETEDQYTCPGVLISVTSSDYSDTNCNEPSWVPFDGANRELGGPYEVCTFNYLPLV